MQGCSRSSVSLCMLLLCQWLPAYAVDTPPEQKPEDAGQALRIPPGARPVRLQDLHLPEENKNIMWTVNHQVPGKAREPPNLVFRFDFRDPHEVFKTGLQTRQRQREGKSSIFGWDVSRHTVATVENSETTNYISTTRLPKIAETFGNNLDSSGRYRFFDSAELAEAEKKIGPDGKVDYNHRPVDLAHDGVSSAEPLEGWVFIIKPDPSFINVFQSLGPDGYLDPEHRSQQEFAAMEQISPDRIIGAYDLQDPDRMVIFNPTYNQAYNGQRAGIGYQRLAHNSNEQLAEMASIIREAAEVESQGLRLEAAKHPVPMKEWKPMPLSQFIQEFNAYVTVTAPDAKTDTDSSHQDRPGNDETTGKTYATDRRRPNEGAEDDGVGGKRIKVVCPRSHGCDALRSLDEHGAARELTPIVEAVSARHFEMLARKHGLKPVVEDAFQQSLPSFRSDRLGYHGAASESHPLPSSFGGQVLSSAGKSLQLLGGGLYAYGLVEVMVKNASTIDRVAALTSIVPIVGCGTSIAAQVSQGNAGVPERIDDALCAIGDVLLLTPLAPVGEAIHICRFAVTLTKVLDAYISEPEQARAVRDQGWETFLQDHMYRRLSSVEFGTKLRYALAVESLALLSDGAHMMGILQASRQGALRHASNATVQEQALLEDFFRNATEQVEANISDELVQGQRQTLLNTVYSVLEKHQTASLRALADQYNKAFVQDKLAGAADRIKKFAYNNKLPLPNHLVVAYLIGQSLGQATKQAPPSPPSPSEANAAPVPSQAGNVTTGQIHAQTLNLTDYLQRKQHGLAKAEMESICIQQGHAVTNLLGGQGKMEDVAKASPKLDPSAALDFQILVAMKLGLLFQHWKPSSNGKLQLIPESLMEKPGIIGTAMGIAEEIATELVDAYCEIPILKDLMLGCKVL
ncbi:hypothetical protein DCS_08234 [Drechmeria coniospora]|uniref:Uncharacterized protein n=1 Tax=Drechmeria coniospora TaxID=98403 RepID=A0A151GGQ1_DRECN|nr:hypothetical protein DCS_08234 [Drechmeria coniospora]KYK56264.1 hypothetical protein DCS_08234 [Drechmeria coniospora]